MTFVMVSQIFWINTSGFEKIIIFLIVISHVATLKASYYIIHICMDYIFVSNLNVIEFK